MSKTKLNFRFHNPNTVEATADYILKMLIEANREKAEQSIQAAADTTALPLQPIAIESHSA